MSETTPPEMAPELAAPKFELSCRRFRKCKQARLKITTTSLALELPLDLPDDAETRYRLIAVSILKRCQTEGIPGPLYGKFEPKYDRIVMKHLGTPYLQYLDQGAFERDRQEFKRLLEESFAQTANVSEQKLIVPAGFDTSGFGDV